MRERPDGPASEPLPGLPNGFDPDRVRDFARSASDWFWETDGQHRFSFVSQRFFELTGLTPDEVYGRRAKEIGIRPADDEQRTRLVECWKARTGYRDLVFSLDTPRGLFWARGGAVPVFDATGRWCGYRGAATDITELVRMQQALHDSEQRFRDYAGASGDWFWDADPQFRYRHIWGRLEEVTGIRPDEVVGRSRQDFSIECVDPGEAELQRLIAERRPYRNIVCRATAPDGRKFWLRAGATPVFGADGSFQGYRGATSDITALVRAQQALRLSEQRFHDFAEASGDWFWELGPDLRFTFMSESVETFTNTPRSWYQNRHPAELIGDSGDIEAWQRHLADLEAHRPFRDFRFSRPNPDGSLRWVSISGRPVFAADGAFLGYRGVASDVTEEVRAELRLREFAALVQSSNDSILGVDTNGLIVSFNPAAERVYGYSEAEAVGQHVSLLTGSAEQAAMQAALYDQALRGEAVHGVEVTRTRKNGTALVVAISLTPIRDDYDRIIGVCGIGRDITARKLAEAKLAAQHDDLARLNDQKDRLLSIIGHDLRSPFNVILGFADLLHSGADTLNPAQVREFASQMLGASRQAYALLEELLDWSRLQSGRMEFQPELLDLGPLVARTAESLQAVAEAKGVALACHSGSLPPVLADGRMIATVLRNLVGNAIKFTPGRGLVEVRTGRRADGVIVSVRDSGVGLTEEQLAALDRDGQMPSLPGTAGEAGTGLGLALCRELVGKHGSRLEFDGAPGAGTTVRFRLPLAAG